MRPEIAFGAFLCCLLIIAICAGNLMVVLVVIKTPKLRRQLQNWFLVSLAVSDFSVGSLVMPLTLAYEVQGAWNMGVYLCEVWLALDVLFVTSSILNLCLISLDRYFAITKTMIYIQNRTLKRVALMIAVVWLISLAISIPPLAGWKDHFRGSGNCSLSTDVGYVLYSSMGSFFVPVILIVFVYAKLYVITRQRAKKQQATLIQTETTLNQLGKHKCESFEAPEVEIMVTPADNNDVQHPKYIRYSGIDESNLDTALFLEDVSNMTPDDPRSGIHSVTNFRKTKSAESLRIKCKEISDKKSRKSFSTAPAALKGKGKKISCFQLANGSRVEDPEQIKKLRTRKRHLRRKELRSTLILGTILGAFILCWLPFFTIYVLAAVCCEAPEALFDTFFWLGYCNSVINPFIYTILNNDFRHGLQALLRCR